MPDSSTFPAALERSLAAAGHAVRSLHRLEGDVSSRIYYRATFASGESAIVATYPAGPGTGCQRFARSTGLLETVGVRVPEIYAADCAAGWMLMEDLGNETLFDRSELSWSALLPFLEQASEMQRRISTLPLTPVSDLNAPLDTALMKRELEQTWNLFLRPRRLTGDADLTATLEHFLGDLCDALGDAPGLPAHRDFMARNLVPTAMPPGLALIDHQDLRLAPPFYDLASLLNDSLFPPVEIEDRLLRQHAPDDASRRGYRRAAVQRTLKAVGTFAAFADRGFPRHLRLVGPTLERTLTHLAALPGGAALAARLRAAWQPVIATPQA